MPPTQRSSKACSICHQKKIKCDWANNNQPCTNCRLGDYTCRPHQRKRKLYVLSPSPPRHIPSPKRSAHDVSSSIDLTGISDHDITFSDAAATEQQPHHRQSIEDGASSSPLTQRPSSPKSQNSRNYEVPTQEQSYVGRSDYLSTQIPFTEDTTVPQKNNPPSRENELADLDLQFLTLRKALELPPRAIRESLIDAFMEHCHPWMPIVERRWLEESGSEQRPPSLLLLQAVLLAGSRVLSSPLVQSKTSSSELYERARALFFHGHEKNTTLAIVSVCLLQWWNPTGPEKFSMSTSGFWVRIGVELAYQVGLHKEPPEGPFRSFRRRLWWSLVSRDSLISVGTGRPRTINLEDSNMTPPTLHDFAIPNNDASLFVAYVSICRQVGDIAEAQRRKTLHNTSCRQRLEDGLFRWLKELPPALQLAKRQHNDGEKPSWITSPYNFEARQLAIIYFVSLLILHRSANPQTSVPTVCLLASSYIANIMEEFLSRDQIRYLGPVFAFFALAAGLVQLTLFRYESLQGVAEHEFTVIHMALEELGKRWGSAHGALRGFIKAKAAIRQQPRLPGLPSPLDTSLRVFFSDFGPDLCRIWDVVLPSSGHDGGFPSSGGSAPHAETSVTNWGPTLPVDVSGTSIQGPRGTVGLPLLQDGGLGAMPEFAVEDMALFEDPLAHAEGSWLFEDFDLQSVLSGAFNPST